MRSFYKNANGLLFFAPYDSRFTPDGKKAGAHSRTVEKMELQSLLVYDMRH